MNTKSVLLQTGINAINNKPLNHKFTITAVFFFEDENQQVSNTKNAEVTYTIIGSDTVVLKTIANSDTQNLLYNRVTYLIDTIPFIKCDFSQDLEITKRKVNNAGGLLIHQLKFQFPNIFGVFNFPSNKDKFAKVPVITSAQLKYPWIEKQDVLVITDWLYDRPTPILNVNNNYWGCPFVSPLGTTSLVISGGIEGDNYGVTTSPIITNDNSYFDPFNFIEE